MVSGDGMTNLDHARELAEGIAEDTCAQRREDDKAQNARDIISALKSSPYTYLGECKIRTRMSSEGDVEWVATHRPTGAVKFCQDEATAKAWCAEKTKGCP